MRPATAILICLVVLLVLCFAGGGMLLWQRARVAQNRAFYAERMRAEAMAAEKQATLRAELALREAGGQALPGEDRPDQEASAVKESLGALAYGDEKERVRALLALSQRVEVSDASLKALIGALGDHSSVVRGLAATLLGTLGRDAAPAAFALSAKLTEPAVRDAALYALRAIGTAGDGAIAPLEGLLESADPAVQEAATKALEAVRGRPEER